MIGVDVIDPDGHLAQSGLAGSSPASSQTKTSGPPVQWMHSALVTPCASPVAHPSRACVNPPFVGIDARETSRLVALQPDFNAFAPPAPRRWLCEVLKESDLQASRDLGSIAVCLRGFINAAARTVRHHSRKSWHAKVSCHRSFAGQN